MAAIELTENRALPRTSEKSDKQLVSKSLAQHNIILNNTKPRVISNII